MEGPGVLPDDIRFDEGAARRLDYALVSFRGLVQDYGQGRYSSANLVMQEFAGHYAMLFVDACEAELKHRRMIYRVIDELREWIRSAGQAADDAWQQGRGFVVHLVEPHHVPSLRPPLERVRHGFGENGGKSSAQPEALRIFERVSNRYTSELHSELERLTASLSQFESQCSSAIIYGWQGFVSALSNYIEENHLDAVWMRQVANAFEKAGSGTVLDAGITATVLSSQPAEFSEFLFDEDLTIEEIHVAWLTFVDQHGSNDQQVIRFIETYCFELASLDGIPFAVQDQAGRAALKEIGTIPKDLPTVYDPEFHGRLASARHRMGLPPIKVSSDFGRAKALNDFAKEIRGVRTALKIAGKDGSESVQAVQLVGFGLTMKQSLQASFWVILILLQISRSWSQA